MTVKEFQDFINSFNKEPGSYTKEEYYKIGQAHKSLDNKDKSWLTLCKVVGWPGTPDSYRSFVNWFKKKEMVCKEEVEHQTQPSDYELELRRLYIEKTKVRDINNDYRRNMRDEARIESLREDMQRAAKELWDLPEVKSAETDTHYRKTEAVVSFADLHLGPDFENSYNAYSYKIAVRRVQKYIDDVVDYCKKNNVETLHVLNLGDLISGTIHTTLRIQQSMDVTQQIMKAGELLAEVLNQLQAAAPNVLYRSVTDNHARAIPDKSEHIEKENFQNLIDWFVEERLKGTSIQFMHDNIDPSIGKFKLKNGKVVMFAHGHLESRNQVVQNMVALTREIPDYIFLAHYHNSAEKTFQGFKVFITGSIIGVDEYAYSKRLFSHAEQKLVIFDEDNFLDITLDLQNA